MSMKNMNFKVEEELRDEFGGACQRNRDGTPSHVLRMLMKDYIAGRISYSVNMEKTRDDRKQD